jgi:hypothetical protein
MKKTISYFVTSCIVSACLLLPPTMNSNTSSVEAAVAMALISGTVNDDSGKPLAGAIVALFTAQPGQTIGGSLLRNLTTDGSGKFQTNVAPGMYRVRAVADGFRPTFTLITLDAANKITHNFSLRRTGTLIEKRGDKGDYRWIGRSVPRSILHYEEESLENSVVQYVAPKPKSEFHGIAQLTSSQAGDANFFGANFALSSSFGDNIEVALIGQIGRGEAAPQSIRAIASMRPKANHQVTTSVGFGQTVLREGKQNRTLDQFSFAAVDQWQVADPLVLILGFDYSSFGNFGKGKDSILPRVGVQFTPNSRTHLNASLTPGANESNQSREGFESENIQTRFEMQSQELALNNRNEALMDRSRRMEAGIERILGEDGNSSLAVAAFYDVISNHGVGVLSLPLEASPEAQNAFQEIARNVVAMNGGARGMRVMYAKRINDYVTASAGYSFGRGERINEIPSGEPFTPANLFSNSNFQVASAKLDLDLTHRTGTRISTVVRLSPSAVIFAIDPFAGKMGVYDPNLSIYVTQALPNFGLPVKCQALIDVRNLLNQMNGVEGENVQLVAARSQRSVRGAISFRW